MLERFSNPDREIGMRRSAQRDRVKMRLLCKRLQKLHGASFMSYAGLFPLNGVGGTHYCQFHSIYTGSTVTHGNRITIV
ncbi:hypothetical protein ACJRO7_009448 [Eucalyptus globulus]|uniref:Uncharacterized protein n=1 Tax=Eucalyptus globulus TaxID=34317 RepID=A0ABD3LC92_EUCGL